MTALVRTLPRSWEGRRGRPLVLTSSLPVWRAPVQGTNACFCLGAGAAGSAGAGAALALPGKRAAGAACPYALKCASMLTHAAVLWCSHGRCPSTPRRRPACLATRRDGPCTGGPCSGCAAQHTLGSKLA